LRRVPVALTHGWGGIGRDVVDGAPARLMAAPSAAVASAALGRFTLGSGSRRAMRDAASLAADTGEFPALDLPDGVLGLGRRRGADRDATTTPPRVHDALVLLQRADGSWDLDATLAQAVSATLRDMEQALKNATGDRAVARRALATAVALAWLEKHASAARAEWEMLAQKALAWLSASRAEPAAGAGWNDWLDVARQFV
jgi:hypothetical protein